jgi:transcriptional regulator with XRE-family HTH domain
MEQLTRDDVKTRAAQKVYALMIRDGLSQTDVSRMSGVPTTTINRLVKGTSVPTVVTLFAVASAFGLSVNALIR